MEQSNLLQYFEGKTIFITGATGFLAKVFVEKILRVQPNIKKLFLLIREPANKTIEQRLQEEVVDTELFRVLRGSCGEDFDSLISSKVIPISGDVACENLGITDSELKEILWQEIDIIVNSAATTNFFERYDVAFGINTMGTQHVRDFAIKCSKLEMLLQVSTAYVHGTKSGLIAEEPLHMGDTHPGAEITLLDINVEKMVIEEKLRALQVQKATEKEIVRAMKDLGTGRAKKHGWPNTYVFTKAMGEMVLEKFKEKAKIIVLRPTIITSIFRDPFPGWVEGVRTMDDIFVAYGKGKLKCFVGDPDATLDIIPGDMVVHCMIAAISWHSNVKKGLFVYHVGSSRQNPILLGEVRRIMLRYLTKNPLLDMGGNPIRVQKLKLLNTMPKFHTYISIHYLPFLKIFKLINMLSLNHFESTYSIAKHRVNKALRLAEVYEPYLFSQAIFDDANTENLRVKIRESDMNMDMLNFDPKSIAWDEYLLNTHFQGLVKYAL
ncbi:hypothetical protein ACS0TY_008749 [Phlomoides rotata]